MTLVRMDIVYDDCPSQLSNTLILDPTIFQYPKNQPNVTVFCGCPSSFGFRRNFTCNNDKTKLGFYAEETEELLQQFPELKECLFRVKIPILREVNDGGITSLKQAVVEGFDVLFNINSEEDIKCSKCKKTNGVCGIDEDPNAHSEYGRATC